MHRVGCDQAAVSHSVTAPQGTSIILCQTKGQAVTGPREYGRWSGLRRRGLEAKEALPSDYPGTNLAGRLLKAMKPTR